MAPKKTKKNAGNDTGFSIVVGGQIESANFGGIDNLYCKYCRVYKKIYVKFFFFKSFKSNFFIVLIS